MTDVLKTQRNVQDIALREGPPMDDGNPRGRSPAAERRAAILVEKLKRTLEPGATNAAQESPADDNMNR